MKYNLFITNKYMLYAKIWLVSLIISMLFISLNSALLSKTPPPDLNTSDFDDLNMLSDFDELKDMDNSKPISSKNDLDIDLGLDDDKNDTNKSKLIFNKNKNISGENKVNNKSKLEKKLNNSLGNKSSIIGNNIVPDMSQIEKSTSTQLSNSFNIDDDFKSMENQLNFDDLDDDNITGKKPNTHEKKKLKIDDKKSDISKNSEENKSSILTNDNKNNKINELKNNPMNNENNNKNYNINKNPIVNKSDSNSSKDEKIKIIENKNPLKLLNSFRNTKLDESNKQIDSEYQRLKSQNIEFNTNKESMIKNLREDVGQSQGSNQSKILFKKLNTKPENNNDNIKIMSNLETLNKKTAPNTGGKHSDIFDHKNLPHQELNKIKSKSKKFEKIQEEKKNNSKILSFEKTNNTPIKGNSKSTKVTFPNNISNSPDINHQKVLKSLNDRSLIQNGNKSAQNREINDENTKVFNHKNRANDENSLIDKQNKSETKKDKGFLNLMDNLFGDKIKPMENSKQDSNYQPKNGNSQLNSDGKNNEIEKLKFKTGDNKNYSEVKDHKYEKNAQSKNSPKKIFSKNGFSFKQKEVSNNMFGSSDSINNKSINVNLLNEFGLNDDFGLNSFDTDASDESLVNKKNFNDDFNFRQASSRTNKIKENTINKNNNSNNDSGVKNHLQLELSSLISNKNMKIESENSYLNKNHLNKNASNDFIDNINNSSTSSNSRTNIDKILKTNSSENRFYETNNYSQFSETSKNSKIINNEVVSKDLDLLINNLSGESKILESPKEKDNFNKEENKLKYLSIKKEKINKNLLKNYFKPEPLDISRLQYLDNLITNVIEYNIYLFSFEMMCKKNQWKMNNYQKQICNSKKIMNH